MSISELARIIPDSVILRSDHSILNFGKTGNAVPLVFSEGAG